MKCPRCGKSTEAGEKFCPYCGTPVGQGRNVQSAGNPRMKWILGILGVVVVLAVVIGVVLGNFFSHKDLGMEAAAASDTGSKTDVREAVTPTEKEERVKKDVRGQTTEQTAEPTAVPTEAPTVQEQPVIPALAQYRDSYQALLNEASMTAGGGQCIYSVYDVNQDGIYELIIKEGTCEADYTYYVYTVLGDSLQVVQAGSLTGSHSRLYLSENGPGIAIFTAYMGEQRIAEILMENQTIIENVILQEETGTSGVYQYPQDLVLSACYVTDSTLLADGAALTGNYLNDTGDVDQGNVATAPAIITSDTVGRYFCADIGMVMNVVSVDGSTATISFMDFSEQWSVVYDDAVVNGDQISVHVSDDADITAVRTDGGFQVTASPHFEAKAYHTISGMYQ